MNRNITAQNAPVLLLTYKKHEFLSEIFESITKYKPTKLYISQNLAKDETEHHLTEKVRSEILNFNFPFNTEYIFHPTHLNINTVYSSTVDYVFTKEETLIVLEDDVVPSSSFFSFCNEMLNKYAGAGDVGYVGGCNLNAVHRQNSYFYTNFCLPHWGWATWKDKWLLYKSDNFYWDNYKPLILSRFLDQNRDYISQVFEGNSRGVNVWDIQWSLALISNNLKSIMPGINLITNKGFVKHATSTIYSETEYGNTPKYRFTENKLCLIQDNSLQDNYESAIIQFLSEMSRHLKGSGKNRIINS